MLFLQVWVWAQVGPKLRPRRCCLEKARGRSPLFSLGFCAQDRIKKLNWKAPCCYEEENESTLSLSLAISGRAVMMEVGVLISGEAAMMEVGRFADDGRWLLSSRDSSLLLLPLSFFSCPPLSFSLGLRISD